MEKMTKEAFKEADILAERFCKEVSDIVQLILDLTSRIDDRAKNLSNYQREMDVQFEKLLIAQQNFNEKLKSLESKDCSVSKTDAEIRDKVHSLDLKMENFNLRMGHHDNRWTQVFDSFWKITLMIIAGYILYKLGLQSPPI